MSSDTTMHVSADDIVGILIHNANQAASHLAVHGVKTNWAAFHDHLTRMQDLAARAHALVHSDQGVSADDDNVAAGAPN